METPKQLAKALGEIGRGDEVLASILASEGSPELVAAIRASFEKGNEQGNMRRVEALVGLEGEGALDLVEAILRDESKPGGIYYNLRNGTLALIAEHFHADPRLREPLFRAIEIDEYLDGDQLGVVLLPFDRERGLELLGDTLRWGSTVAIRAFAELPEGPAKLGEALDNALQEADTAQRFIDALVELANEDYLATKILARADAIPAAAVFAVRRDPSRAPALAERFEDKSSTWRSAAIKAFEYLPPERVFEIGSPLFSDPKRAKGAARARLDAFAWEVKRLADPRWIPFLIERLAAEDAAKLRMLVVKALGKTGPDAAAAIANAARDDKDRDVMQEIPLAISRIGGGAATTAVIEAAIEGLSGKRKKALQTALNWVSE